MYWASAATLLVGLLFMRIPTLTCRCDSPAFCVATLQSTLQSVPNAHAHASCCAQHAQPGADDERPSGPKHERHKQDSPMNCDCGCTLCKTTTPTPFLAPLSADLSDLPAGLALVLTSSAAPDVDRLTLLRPPRL